MLLILQAYYVTSGLRYAAVSLHAPYVTHPMLHTRYVTSPLCYTRYVTRLLRYMVIMLNACNVTPSLRYMFLTLNGH